MEKDIVSTKPVDKADVRKGILEFEKRLDDFPNSVTGEEANKLCPLKHTFVEGMYIRKIFMPKGVVLTSKIHKKRHPYFVMKGACSVLTDEGILRIKAPYYGITEPGTKRILCIHEDTVWITVHSNPDDGEDLKKIEGRIIAKSFDEIPFNKKEILKLKEK